MTMSTHPCNQIQECIAVGDVLSEPDQAHVLACPGCANVAKL